MSAGASLVTWQSNSFATSVGLCPEWLHGEGDHGNKRRGIIADGPHGGDALRVQKRTQFPGQSGVMRHGFSSETGFNLIHSRQTMDQTAIQAHCKLLPPEVQATLSPSSPKSSAACLHRLAALICGRNGTLRWAL